MKNLALAASVVSILAIGVLAFAHGPGGWGGGQMTGPGYYGGHMMGPGFGGHMMGSGGPGYGADRDFLDETVELRKKLHDKRFEYFEARRNPETDAGTLTGLEKEIREMQDKIYEKAPRTFYGGYGGYGRCW